MAAIEFATRFRADPYTAGVPETTPLTRVVELWSEVFPGRDLRWRDWKPLIKSRTSGSDVEYTGNTMSDGERAALFLAGRVFTAPAGILVIDEPETHFHTLLAVRFWNALQAARRDLRFIYVTHDLSFALSRRDARFVLASPTAGLRTIDLDSRLPSDVAEALLGSASLSFYASRVVFCEGEADSLDAKLYSAWFNGPDTVLRSVGSCQQVIRCVDALSRSAVASSLTAEGIVDGDYNSDAFKDNLPEGVTPLKLHEVESIFCIPAVVEAVTRHTSRPFDLSEYVKAQKATVSEAQRHQ